MTNNLSGIAYALSIDSKIDDLMTLNCDKFEFSENFARFRRFERQQQLNE